MLKKILKIFVILIVMFSLLISMVSIYILVKKERSILYAQCLTDEYPYGINCQFRNVEHLGCIWRVPHYMKYKKNKERFWFTISSFLHIGSSISFYNDKYQPIKAPSDKERVSNDLKIKTYVSHNPSRSILFTEITRDNYKGAVRFFNIAYIDLFLNNCINGSEK
ncbi:hypothetical protein THERMOT_1287 [Bathymodiolus thermophilus thioautotrophic gill symbiont]|uniref:hypothetical protein n=1 Tax=Bathymodiolus thermophilus thioautotrophic gill symbiont TaxID=2360 RepID=UPI00192A7B85|nr:hypothetical protein [Bathymodiolus thermophilus thioautotrophic gill symbiont]CAB5500675.1 hypothetical protein THERMOT_1287 [Bathymodiolus thermophilus thioautotrophic gill symbiont]